MSMLSFAVVASVACVVFVYAFVLPSPKRVSPMTALVERVLASDMVPVPRQCHWKHNKAVCV